MPVYKVVLEIETSYSQEELAQVLDRVHALPREHDPDCRYFDARVLAVAETKSSRNQ